MKLITLKLDDRELPCSPTMGAALLFHERTGKEVTEIDLNKLSEVMPYLWACIEIGAERAGKELDITYKDFCNMTSTVDLAQWQQQLAELMEEEVKKKVKPKTPTPTAKKKTRNP